MIHSIVNSSQDSDYFVLPVFAKIRWVECLDNFRARYPNRYRHHRLPGHLIRRPPPIHMRNRIRALRLLVPLPRPRPRRQTAQARSQQPITPNGNRNASAFSYMVVVVCLVGIWEGGCGKGAPSRQLLWEWVVFALTLASLTGTPGLSGIAAATTV
jgi:hypothetical protein